MENEFDLKIIAPKRIVYEGKAKMVELTTSEGKIGIYQKHIPLTAVIFPGIFVITEEKGKKYGAIHDGFLEILPWKVTILAEQIEWSWEIDLERAREAKKRAQEQLLRQETQASVQKAEMALARALVRIEAAEKNR